MLVVNENNLEWAQAAMPNLMLKNVLTNYQVGEGQISCGISKWAYGEAGQAHTHDAQDEIYIVLRGEGRIYAEGDEPVIVRPGDIMYAKCGEMHGMLEGLTEGGVEMFYALIPTEKKEA